MCLVFNRRISEGLAREIKDAGGNYRQIGGGNKGWLVSPARWDAMASLVMRHELWECADAIRRCSDLMQEDHDTQQTPEPQYI